MPDPMGCVTLLPRRLFVRLQNLIYKRDGRRQLPPRPLHFLSGTGKALPIASLALRSRPSQRGESLRVWKDGALRRCNFWLSALA